VVYADAFQGSGVEAAVTYTYGVGKFRQDVIFTKRPSVGPADFGMGERTRLEIYTEFSEGLFSLNRPRILKGETNSAVRAKMVEPDLVDEKVAFSDAMPLTPGRAFLTSQRAQYSRGIEVAKRLLTTEGGRTVLAEAVEWRAAAKDLETLPKGLASAGAGRVRPDAGRNV
jgi:hypothetical protein